jgi:outer membrane protein TolC
MMPIKGFPGDSISLGDAVNIYVYNTKYIKTERLKYENALLEYENHQKSFLPSLEFNLAPVSFNHSMRLLQNYSTGQYNNIEEFSNTTYGGLNISQKLGLTGGTFQLSSSLSFLREFSSNKNSFSSTPLYISYSQSLFGGGKRYKFEKAIYHLRNAVTMKNYCTSVSYEQQNILTLYLEAYSNMMDVQFYSKTVNIGDTILMHALLRKKSGKITEYDYNQVELQQLESKIQLQKSIFAYESSLRRLADEIGLDKIGLKPLTDTNFPHLIDSGVVMQHVRRNNPELQNMEIEKLQAKYTLYNAKLKNKFNADISLSYGLNQYAQTFRQAYTNPDRQQAISISLSVPVFQWGINRNEKKIAENEYEKILLNQEKSIKEFNESIYNSVFSYNHSKSLTDIADQKYKLSARQYEFAAIRFSVGNISAIELTTANKIFFAAKQEYMTVMKSLYINYYKIRHLTLHDFILNQDLTDIIDHP